MKLVKMFSKTFAIIAFVLAGASLLLTAFFNTSTVNAEASNAHVHSEQCVHEHVEVGSYTNFVTSDSTGRSQTEKPATKDPAECGCGCIVYECDKCWTYDETNKNFKNTCPGLDVKTGTYACPLDISQQPWYQSMMDIVDIVDSLLTPILIIGGSVGAIFVIILGVNFSKAESADKREEAKKRMINAIIGVVVTILLLILIKLFTSNATAIVKWINTAGNK